MLEQNNQEYLLDQNDGFTVSENINSNFVESAYIEFSVQIFDNSIIVLGFAILDEELGIIRDKVLVSITQNGQIIMIQQSKPHLEQVYGYFCEKSESLRLQVNYRK